MLATGSLHGRKALLSCMVAVAVVSDGELQAAAAGAGEELQDMQPAEMIALVDSVGARSAALTVHDTGHVHVLCTSADHGMAWQPGAPVASSDGSQLNRAHLHV